MMRGKACWFGANNCNRIVAYQLSEKVTIYTIPVFIKAVVFHHVGSSWMIKTKGKYDFSVDAHYALWCTVWPWFNQIVFKTYVDPNLRISLSLRVKIDMNWFVDYTHMTKKWQVNWCNEIWRCKTATRRFYNIISQLSLCQSKIHRRLVKKISR